VTAWYKAPGESAVKTQTVEVATTVDDDAQYTMYSATFAINWDEVGNVVEAGDKITFRINLETDTSECDDIILNDGLFRYQTKTPALEIP